MAEKDIVERLRERADESYCGDPVTDVEPEMLREAADEIALLRRDREHQDRLVHFARVKLRAAMEMVKALTPENAQRVNIYDRDI